MSVPADGLSNSFSAASLTSGCGTIAHRALSSAVEIDELVKTVGGSSNASLNHTDKIAFLSTKLQQFRHTTDQLQLLIQEAKFIAPSLQDGLTQTVPVCSDAMAVLDKQIKRLDPEHVSRVNKNTMDKYEELLVANSRAFLLFMQLLTADSLETQDEKLHTEDAMSLLERASASSRMILQRPSILSDEAGTGSTPEPSATFAELPPYPAAASSSSSSASAQNSGSKAAGFSFSSLTNSFKAMTANLRFKPEPLVSALCQAATGGNIQVIKGLLAEGANINGRNEDGYTPLICAAVHGHLPAVKFLLEKGGADRTIKDSNKRRPVLFHAIEGGHLDVAKYMLSRGAEVNEKNWRGGSYFYDVVASERLDAVQLLLQHGADPNATNSSGSQPISVPVSRGNIELTKLLLSRGADVNARDSSGNSLLALAVKQEGRTDLVKLLLERGGDPNGWTITGVTLLADAMLRNQLELAKLFLTRGADANCRDAYGTTVLVAILKDTKRDEDERIAAVRLLLTYSASPNHSDAYGVPAISHAAELRNPEIFRLFLERGANPNVSVAQSPSAYASADSTLLLNAITRRRWDQVRLLLKHGGNPNLADKQGRTPLLQALQKRRLDMVELLLRHGANVNQLGQISPLAFASALGNRGVAQMLIARGAKAEDADVDAGEDQDGEEVADEEDESDDVDEALSTAATAGASSAARGGRVLGDGLRAHSPPPGYDAVAIEKGAVA